MKIQYRQFKLVVVTGILLISICLITSHGNGSRSSLITKAAGNIVYVSPSGLDSNPGSLNSPVKSLVKARDLSRSAKVNGFTNQVNLLPGSYKMDYTLNLNASDSNTLWKSSSIGTVKIVGSSVISNNWQSLGNNLYKNNLPQITNYPRQLYVNGQKAVRSTSQNGPVMNLSANSNQIFGVTGASNWSNPTDIEASGFNKSYWKHSRQKVSSVTDTTLNLNQNWANIPNSNAWGLGFVADNITVENAKELINEDNEWYYDRSEKTLYYKSNTNPNEKSFSLPIQEKLVDISGASDIEFNGISFEEASWERPNISGTQDYQGGVMFTSPNSSWSSADEQVVPGHITMNNVNGVKFINNQFKNLGGAAFSCFENCINNIIEKNSFGDIAANAITIGNHQNKYSGNNNNKFNFNTLTNIGSEYYSTVPIFVIYAGGTEIAYNTILNTPYSAISVGWGWADQDSNLRGNLNVVGNNQVLFANGKYGLKFGNVNSDNVINSVDRIRSRLSPDRINGYAIEDINMDGNLTSTDRILSRLNYDSIERV